MPERKIPQSLAARKAKMYQCFDRLMEVWPVDDRPKITLGMGFSGVTFDARNPKSGDQAEAANAQASIIDHGETSPKKPTGIQYPSDEAKTLVDELMYLGAPITKDRFKLMAKAIPQKYRDDIAQMYEFTRLKSILEYDPRMGFSFTTKHRSDLRGAYSKAFQWIAHQRREGGLELSPNSTWDEESRFTDRFSMRAENLRAYKGQSPGYDDPTAMVSEQESFGDSEGYDIKSIIGRALEQTRQRLEDSINSDSTPESIKRADAGRLQVLENRITACDDRQKTLQEIATEVGVSKQCVQQYEAIVKASIANNAAGICLEEKDHITDENLELVAVFARTTLSDAPANISSALITEAKRKTALLAGIIAGERQR
jgi:hypothetical protein